LGRHFHWRPIDCDEMPMDELAAYFEDAKKFLKIESEAK
jgi:hypothetical protein